MRQITLSRFLIEDQRDKNVIALDPRWLIEAGSRACKAISIPIGNGRLAGQDGSLAQGGELRLMHEANPMALIVEQAGAAATNGRRQILDTEPLRRHQRVTVIPGSRFQVERASRRHGR